MATCSKCGKEVSFWDLCSDDKQGKLCPVCWDKLHDSPKEKESGKIAKETQKETNLLKALPEIYKIEGKLHPVSPLYWIKVGFWIALGFSLFSALMILILMILSSRFREIYFAMIKSIAG